MKTEYVEVDGRNPDSAALGRPAEILRNGGLVAFPTETVYGLGANGLDGEACRKIFAAKERPADNPLILHVADIEGMKPLVRGLDEGLIPLLEAAWPGPLTVVLRRSELVPDVVTAGGDTVAVRCPSHPVARELIRLAGVSVAAPSANRSGRPSPTNAKDVLEDMDGRVDCVVDGGACAIGIESTVVDLTETPAVILRPGFYTEEYLGRFLPGVTLDDALVDDAAIPRSPGQKYRHYAPKARLTVYVGEPETVRRRIIREIGEARARGKKAGALLFEGGEAPEADLVLRQGTREDLVAMSKGLFSSLRAFDRAGVDVIFAEGAPRGSEYARSIMNRLRKSASGRVIELG